jgi:hypothetical protein
VRYERHLTNDPALRAMLASVPLPLYVFTNGDDAHAEACLKALGVRDLFKARAQAQLCSTQPRIRSSHSVSQALQYPDTLPSPFFARFVTRRA